MPIFNIFSKRKAAQDGEKNDVYQYDTAPEKLRVQIVHILEEAIGSDEDFCHTYSATRQAYVELVRVLRRGNMVYFASAVLAETATIVKGLNFLTIF
jgi:hypothetical protein